MKTTSNQKYDHSLSQILSLSGPIALSLLTQALYNIIDSFFISRYSANGFTALSIAFPLQLFLIAIGTGISTGTGINIAYYLGKKQNETASSTLGQGIILSFAHWGILLPVWYLFIPFYFSFLSPSYQVEKMGITYSFIVCFFSLFQFWENISSRALYAHGNSVLPMFAQISGAIFNIILDPILIYGYKAIPSLGSFGAALATISGQFLSMLLSFLFLSRKTPKLPITSFKPNRFLICRIYKSGFPTFFMQSMVSVYVSGLNAVLKPFGEYAIMSMGVYYKLQTFLLIPTNSISLGITPLMSYHYGAAEYSKIWKIYRQSLLLSFLTLLLGTCCFWIFPRQLLSIFSSDPLLYEAGIPALRIISTSFPFFSFTIIIPVLLQVTGYTKENLLITFLRQIVLLVPLAYIFSYFGATATWLTFPISEIIAAVLSWYYRCKIYRDFFAASSLHKPSFKNSNE